jgi:hypothetical protein
MADGVPVPARAISGSHVGGGAKDKHSIGSANSKSAFGKDCNSLPESDTACCNKKDNSFSEIIESVSIGFSFQSVCIKGDGAPENNGLQEDLLTYGIGPTVDSRIAAPFNISFPSRSDDLFLKSASEVLMQKTISRSGITSVSEAQVVGPDDFMVVVRDAPDVCSDVTTPLPNDTIGEFVHVTALKVAHTDGVPSSGLTNSWSDSLPTSKSLNREVLSSGQASSYDAITAPSAQVIDELWKAYRVKLALNVKIRFDFGDAGYVGATLKCSNSSFDVTFFSDHDFVLQHLDSIAPDIQRIFDGSDPDPSRGDARSFPSGLTSQDLKHSWAGYHQRSSHGYYQDRRSQRLFADDFNAEKKQDFAVVRRIQSSIVSF